jgi:hypothetical protein
MATPVLESGTKPSSLIIVEGDFEIVQSVKCALRLECRLGEPTLATLIPEHIEKEKMALLPTLLPFKAKRPSHF